MKTRMTDTSKTQSLTIPAPEAFRRASIATSAPNVETETVEPDLTAQADAESVSPTQDEHEGAAHAAITSTTDRRFTIIDMSWQVKAVSVRNELVAETALGRFLISARFLTGGPCCDLSIPQIGSNPARKIPCASIEEAQKLAREEIALVVQRLIVEREDINVV
jgi:hypothetical protein